MAARLKRLVSEVRRRKVHRTAGAYVVAAIMALEGADLILPSMAVPTWTYDVLVLFVVALFPIVIVVSWIFDITGRGMVRTDGLVIEPRASAGVRRSVAEADSEVIDSLAILPFRTVGNDPDDEYLSEGIAESIINRMSGLSGLRVVPRASAFRYGGSDVDLAVVGDDLNVRAVVTGRVHHRGTNLLVQAELVDVGREAQLWGEKYSRPMEDVLDLQEEMATEIHRALSQTLSREDERRLRHRETTHTEAYQEYLRGRYHWNERTAEGFRAATRHFREAIGLDPRYARAYSGLADTYNVLGYYSLQAPGESYPPAKVAAEKALELDPSLAEAHASLGYATLFYDRDWEAAAEHFREAIRHDAGYASAHQWYAWYFLVMERFDESVKQLEEAQRLDPLSLIINDHLAYGLLLAGRAEEAWGQIRKTQGLSPDYPLALWRLGDYRVTQGEPEKAVGAYERAVELTDGQLCLGYLGMAKAGMGDVEGAHAVLERMTEESANRYISPLDCALVYAGLGDVDATFEWLKTAEEERVSDLVRLKLLPWPEAVSSDPCFRELTHRLGLPDLAREALNK
jgi:TolB-like protein/Tfp pilus assembly protein PilF